MPDRVLGQWVLTAVLCVCVCARVCVDIEKIRLRILPEYILYIYDVYILYVYIYMMCISCIYIYVDGIQLR